MSRGMFKFRSCLGPVAFLLYFIAGLFSIRTMTEASTDQISPKTFKVFVYGTLKRNLPNHELLLDKVRGKATFIGEGHTVDKFPLVVASKYHIPCLLFCRNVGNQVKGELYEVDEDMLLNLDKLEEHPHFYERVVEPVQIYNDKNSTESKTVDAWIYFIKKMNAQLLEEPYLTDYQNADPDKKYTASSDESTLDDLLQPSC
nr:PREDICTED: putative gamma-glutamylcyclotransferase CG2811 isoform X2 [Bemisia tabaci]